MIDDFVHQIAESSCFFQGHVRQIFSRKFGKVLSFVITYNKADFGDDFNSEKYRSVFSKLLNQKIALRIQDGGIFHGISPDEINIKVIKLVDDVNEEGFCGQFKIYPPTAICTKDGCNHYFELSEGRKCGHKDTDPWEQFTFLAFCDECGRLLPLHFMTNINHKCKKCGENASLTKLKWTRGKDNISSYKVICKKCHNEEGLYFYDCDHKVRRTGECLSTRPKKKFRGVPARAGAIVHPFVISIPDISKDDTSTFGRKTLEMLLSESFTYFFGYEVEESKLNLPEFKDVMLKEEDFWNLTKIQSEFDDVCDEFLLDLTDYSQLDQHYFLIVISRILKNAKNSIEDGANEVRIKKRYGIDFIEKSLRSVKEIQFDENDLQCANLIDSTSRKKKEEPACKSKDYENMLDKFGLKKVVHYPDLTMVQALLGIIEGSTRRNPVLFRTIETGKQNHKKPTVFVRNFTTEGILFQLKIENIFEWLNENKQQIGINNNIFSPYGEKSYLHFRTLLLNDEKCKNAVKTLLHTYSHMMIQQSTIDTGLEIRSLSEIICPFTGSFFIYSTNSINIGGLEFTYDYYLEDWFSRVKELAEDCPQDPGCMIDEGGACNSCSYVPEFVCCNFNQDIDRSTLVGGSDRFIKGYLQ
jgi:DNA-directed RNA polymerase subunit M/transcription elongation factor TFIIS